jgi:hypothetical protein
MGDLVVQGEPPPDDLFGVVGAAFQRGPGEQPPDQLVVAGLEVQGDVRGHAEVQPDLVERLRLGHVAGHAVQDVADATLLRVDEGVAHHVEHDLVGHQLAAVQPFLNGTAQRRAPRHVVPQQVTGGDVRDVEVGGDQRALGAFARAGGRHEQDPHRQSFHRYAPCRLDEPTSLLADSRKPGTGLQATFDQER